MTISRNVVSIINVSSVQMRVLAHIWPGIRILLTQKCVVCCFDQTILITLFALLIAFGAAGNSLVCFVVARNAAMRTPRNIFIINLAISDLTLCLFTQPFNLLKVSD